MTTVIEKPMLFSAPMVRAILEGRKTQTRRIVKPQPHVLPNDNITWWQSKDGEGFDNFHPSALLEYAPHPVGSRIWVRETFAVGPENHGWTNGNGVIYRATQGACLIPECEGFSKWKPSIHMPRWASRITLEVTDVRVQRLWEITAADVFAEGIGEFQSSHPDVAQEMFARLWNSINGPDAWEQNPWLWAYTFRRVDGGGS